MTDDFTDEQKFIESNAKKKILELAPANVQRILDEAEAIKAYVLECYSIGRQTETKLRLLASKKFEETLKENKNEEDER